MIDFQILDCTLRDGGYINNWSFGEDNINSTINTLTEASIDIIEIGFISSLSFFNNHQSKFNSFEDLKHRINITNNGFYVAMINYGEISIDEIPNCELTILSGLRIAFHKKDLLNALDFAAKVKSKGYKIFIQAMVTSNYDPTEFNDLIEKVNSFSPYAFYIVDSFGFMNQFDLEKYYNIVKEKLDKKIILGFHLHNNFQLAYSNGNWAIDNVTSHKLIIDSSLLGMGRGAGNLNTELIYVKKYKGPSKINLILKLIEDIIKPIKLKYEWGYSVKFFLSALHGIHPNYAKYATSNYQLTYQELDKTFEKITSINKVYYNPDVIDNILKEFNS